MIASLYIIKLYAVEKNWRQRKSFALASERTTNEILLWRPLMETKNHKVIGTPPYVWSDRRMDERMDGRTDGRQQHNSTLRDDAVVNGQFSEPYNLCEVFRFFSNVFVIDRT